MSTYAELTAYIQANFTANGQKLITGPKVNTALQDIVNTLMTPDSNGAPPISPPATEFWGNTGSWQPLPITGDMLKSTYDPTLVQADAFDSANTKYLGTGIGAVSRSVQSRVRDSFHLLDYGTPTAGDNSALINTAIAAVNAAGGGYLTMPRGTTPATAITLLGGVTLVGAGKGVASTLLNIGSAPVFMYALGSYGAPIALTVDAAMGATQITVASTAGLVAGDALVIYDNVAYNPIDLAYKSGETVFILSVDSGTLLTLHRPLYGSMVVGGAYAVANAASVKKANFVESPCLADLDISSSLTSATEACYFEITRGTVVDSVRWREWGKHALTLRGAVDAAVINGSAKDLVEPSGTLGGYYATQLRGPCYNIRIQNNTWQRLRHGVTTGGTVEGYPHLVAVQDNLVSDTYAAGLDTHNSGDDITFSDNIISGTATFGLSIRSKNTTVKGGKIIGSTLQGISLEETGLSGVTIDDVEIANTGSHGLSCNESCPNLSLTNLRFRNIGGDGMNLFATADAPSPGLIIQHVNVLGYGIVLPNRYGLITSGPFTSTGALIQDVLVDPMTGTSQYGMRTVSLTNSLCIDNKARGSFVSANFDFLTNFSVNNRQIDVASIQTLITNASTTARASLNIPHGAAPTTPVNGDMWTTTAGAFIRINGVTKTFTLT